jgi:cell division protein FtsL
VGVYLFTINHTAVQGYAIRSAEREIAQAKEENQRLKIEEAELRSLERIESARDRLHLVAVAPGSDTVSYIEAPGPLALR